MLTKMFPFLDPAHITPGLTRRLPTLADDAARLGLGYPVSPTVLQSAPLLEKWTLAMTPRGMVLVGFASGHPIHGDRSVISSPVWFADPDGEWVRTLSRFYRLGRRPTPAASAAGEPPPPSRTLAPITMLRRTRHEY